MKFAMTALAVVFLAQAVPALAEPDINGRDAADRLEPRERHQRDDGGEQARWQAPQAQQPPAPVAAPEPPRARDPGEFRRGGDHEPRVQGDSIGRPGPWSGSQPRESPRPPQDQTRGNGQDHGGDRPRPDGSGRWQDQQHDPQNRGGGDHDGHGWQGRDGRDDPLGNDRRPQDRDGRRDEHHRGDGRGWDGRGWDGRDHDDDRAEHRRWERDRFPPVYRSAQRYRHAWRPPSGFYVRSWGFGDYLPHGWYGQNEWLLDPWTYDLPLPPPGFDWVRVGDDAVLIDRFNGRVIQVVRYLFW